MALHTPSAPPESWEAFVTRCRERITKIRESGDQGHFANIYAEDVEMLLEVMWQSHLEYDDTPDAVYPRVLRQHAGTLVPPPPSYKR